MTLQIREGIYYESKDGRKFGPMRRDGSDAYPWTDGEQTWTDSGRHCQAEYCDDHIVAEWSEPTPQEAGPVRTETVTRMVIVPGVYDQMLVGAVENGTVHLRMHIGDEGRRYSAEQIEALLPDLTSIAKALREAP